MRKILLVIVFLILPLPVLADGSATYSTPGSYSFTVPAYGSLTVYVWGGGGGGGAAAGSNQPSTGGTSQFASVSATGGGYGSSGSNCTELYGSCSSYIDAHTAAGAGGIASGGDTNTNGVAGGTSGSGVGRPGGNAPNGGVGGGTASLNGAAGAAPGGGGSGEKSSHQACHEANAHRICSGVTIYQGGGGGSGAFAAKTYNIGDLTPGSIITVVVGDGGLSIPTYGGAGASGEVAISWTTPPQPTATITSSIGGSMQVGQSSNIYLTATPGSGDTVQYTYINQSVNGGGQTNVLEASGPHDLYVFTPSTAGTYIFYGYAYTAAYPSWYNPSNANVTVTVTSTPTCSVTFSQNPVIQGAPETVTFTSANAAWAKDNTLGPMTPNTTYVVNNIPTGAAAPTDYTCTVENLAGTAQVVVPATLTILPPPICSLAISPSTITKGGSATLTYSSANVTSFTISPNVVTPTQNNTNTASVSPNTSTTYAGTVSGPGGSASCTVPNGSTNTVTVSCTPSTTWHCTGTNNQTIASTTVDASCNTATNNLAACTGNAFCQDSVSSCQYPSMVAQPNSNGSGDLTVRPTLIPKGGTVKIYWNIGNAQSCSVIGTNGDGTAASTLAAPPGAWTTAIGAQTSSPIKQQTTYTLSCTGEDGITQKKETATVNVVPTYQER